MGQIKISVVEDTCLGCTVYRGSIKARDLEPATWIDFYDDLVNPLGYQRPFDKKRSQNAAKYAEKPNAFWPESILAIRDDAEIEDTNDKVIYKFTPLSPGSKFGDLTVDYNDQRTEVLGSQVFKWRRAFSQVDCQHRLGEMSNSDKFVTVCIIPGINRLEEAVIFKTINDTQKKISTSLVDAIIQVSQNPFEAPDVHWAFDLSRDVGSCFHRKVNMEGKNLTGQTYLVTLRTLKTSISSLAGGKRYVSNNMSGMASYDQFYVLIRSYWNEVRSLWPNEFSDTRNFKLMTVPGLKGLARYGRKIFRDAFEIGANSTNLASKVNKVGTNAIDWSSTGALKLATGNAGAAAVYGLLVQNYGTP
ncbi:MAG: DGQHR domain-containing protein [Candidatus Tectomicrobia bacterium]|uniref:DGQHR domain-containing protein n=1 Tax=Tectimicrobiota bacterium TaxID=2528274 RepID=A0A933GN94_UNCTE|nr:DGQHR domain-containing protein [Candidatus Tectomicrobia bacterium]